MKTIKIKSTAWVIIGAIIILTVGILNGCIESKKVAGKGGAQLWAENCQRCHNTPSPASFSHAQWITIGMHMQTRAQLTENEKNKIIAFLSQ
jgi:hypothetical protein